MLSDLQKQAAQAIVNVFETGHVLGEYSQVTLLPGDAGRLTYGRSQTTIGSGGLHDLVAAYRDADGAELAAELAGFVAPLATKDLALDGHAYFKNLLRAAADDPVMRATQDAFFDARYWRPAVTAATAEGLTTPLGVAVVYDSFVHGNWRGMRDRTRGALGSPGQVGEERWVAEYVEQRRAWLAGHSRTVLRATVYRMDAFREMLGLEHWDLAPPFMVRSREVSVATLAGEPPGVYDGPPPRSRDLELTAEMPRGRDVRLVQLALSRPGNDRDVAADGVYGPGTRRHVVAFQGGRGLAVTGVVDGPVFDALGL